MEWYLEKEFDVITGKHPSEEAQKKWRKAVALVRNHRRRFRHVPDLEKRLQLQTKVRQAQVRSFNLYRVSLIPYQMTD